MFIIYSVFCLMMILRLKHVESYKSRHLLLYTEIFVVTELFLYWGYMRTKITRIFVSKWDEIKEWGKLLDEDVRLDILMIVSIQIRVFCDMASCSLVDVYECFRGLDVLRRLTFWFYNDEILGFITTEFLYQLVIVCSRKAFYHVPS